MSGAQFDNWYHGLGSISKEKKSEKKMTKSTEEQSVEIGMGEKRWNKMQIKKALVRLDEMETGRTTPMTCDSMRKAMPNLRRHRNRLDGPSQDAECGRDPRADGRG